jgi:hypothetical protein
MNFNNKEGEIQIHPVIANYLEAVHQELSKRDLILSFLFSPIDLLRR